MLDNDLQPLTPITKENVGLLKAGDWLRVVDASGSDFAAGDLVQIEGWEDLPESRVPIINNLSWRLSRFTYIGPDLGDGWIGRSGGENPVPGMRVRIRTSDGWESVTEDTAWDWTDDIIAFRPALSPPAEGEAVKMLVDDDWLQRRIATDPDGDCEAGCPPCSERCVMVCPQCEGEGHYADGVDEAACSTPCTRCDGNGWIVDLAALRTRPSPVDWERVGPKLVEALERIAADGEPYRNGYCQTDIAVDPALTAQEAQDVARAALAAAQPEGK